MTDLSCRAVIKATGAVGMSILPIGLADNEATAQEPRRLPAATNASGAQPAAYLFFNPEEAAFIEAAVPRLIPADDQWPVALEAGVPSYIDKQLNGAWSAGSHSSKRRTSHERAALARVFGVGTSTDPSDLCVHSFACANIPRRVLISTE